MRLFLTAYTRLGVIGLCVIALLSLGSGVKGVQAADAMKLPPAIGPKEPRVEPYKGDDKLYHQTWFNNSFLDLREDFEEAKSEGKRFAVIFEQAGCIYCVKMHKDVLSQKYINDYVRENYRIVQLNMWGDRQVTDFDGKVMSEKELVRRWRVVFTPWIAFFKDDISGDDGKPGSELQVLNMSLGIGPGTFYDAFTWVRVKGYESDEHFQRFHIRRLNERTFMTEKSEGDSKKKTN